MDKGRYFAIHKFYDLLSFYDSINAEKKFKIRILFDKIYSIEIPEKIREIQIDINLPPFIDAKTKAIISDFETYEKYLEKRIIISY